MYYLYKNVYQKIYITERGRPKKKYDNVLFQPVRQNVVHMIEKGEYVPIHKKEVTKNVKSAVWEWFRIIVKKRNKQSDPYSVIMKSKQSLWVICSGCNDIFSIKHATTTSMRNHIAKNHKDETEPVSKACIKPTDLMKLHKAVRQCVVEDLCDINYLSYNGMQKLLVTVFNIGATTQRPINKIDELIHIPSIQKNIKSDITESALTKMGLFSKSYLMKPGPLSFTLYMWRIGGSEEFSDFCGIQLSVWNKAETALINRTVCCRPLPSTDTNENQNKDTDENDSIIWHIINEFRINHNRDEEEIKKNTFITFNNKPNVLHQSVSLDEFNAISSFAEMFIRQTEGILYKIFQNNKDLELLWDYINEIVLDLREMPQCEFIQQMDEEHHWIMKSYVMLQGIYENWNMFKKALPKSTAWQYIFKKNKKLSEINCLQTFFSYMFICMNKLCVVALPTIHLPIQICENVLIWCQQNNMFENKWIQQHRKERKQLIEKTKEPTAWNKSIYSQQHECLDSLFIKTLKNKLDTKLKTKIIPKLISFHWIGVILNPSTRNNKFWLNQQNARNSAIQQIKSHINNEDFDDMDVDDMDTDKEIKQDVDELERFLEEKFNDEELTRYNENPMLYWSTHKQSYPKLYSFAKRMYVISSSVNNDKFPICTANINDEFIELLLFLKSAQ